MKAIKRLSYFFGKLFLVLFCFSVMADRASKVDALKPLKGLCYVPYTSDWSTNHGQNDKYFDTDYTNSCFPLLWGTANSGRGDIKTFHGLGVNFLRLYDWSAPPNPPGGNPTLNDRNHIPFLDECHTYGIKVTIPFSNYNVFNINNGSFTWIIPNIQAMVEEAYNGGTTPHPAAAMLAVGNEIFLNAAGKDYDLAAQEAIKVVETILEKEETMGIADADKLLITLPISTSTLGHSATEPVGGVYGLKLIEQYAQTSAICKAHNFLTDRYIISLNVEMDGSGSKDYVGDIKAKFPGTPMLFTEFGTSRTDVASELTAVISSENPFQYFDDALMGVSVFTWVGEPDQDYAFPIAETASNPSGTTGTILPSDYKPGGGGTYPVDKIKLYPAFYSIQKIYSTKNSMTVSSGTRFTVTMPATATVASAQEFNRAAAEDLDYDFIKKPIVYIQDADGKRYRAKIITKKFPTDELKCQWTRRLAPGVYSLYIEVNKTSTLVTDYFEVSAPVIDEVVRNDTEEDFIIEVRGNYFGKRAKLFYTFKNLEGKKRTLKCKIIKESQSTEEKLGYAVLKAKYPKKVLKKFHNGDISVNPLDDDSAAKRLRGKTALQLGFTVKNRIGDATSNPVPGSVLVNNTDTIWFVDKKQVAGQAYYNFLFRGSQPLTSAASVDEQTLDLDTLVSTMKTRYDAQNPGAAVVFPTTFKIIDVSLIGFAGSVHDGVGEAPYLFREFVSFGGDSSAGDTTFIMPGEYQPSGSWHSFTSPPAGYTISGKLLWQPVGGITPKSATPAQFPSNIDEGSVAANKAYAKDSILDQAWSRPAFNYIPKPHTPPTFAANIFYDVMENVINEMAMDNGEATIIYVHCMHGHDRTSSVTVSYLMNQTDYQNKHISDAVDEKYVPGTTLMDQDWPHKSSGVSKGKVFKYPYGILVEWYYIYLNGKYSAVPKLNQEGTWPAAPPPSSDELLDFAVGW